MYIALLAPLAAAQAPSDADALYRERADIERVRAAVAIWDARLTADARDFEAAGKAARAMYWIGGHDAQAARRAALERGVAYGRRATAIEPQRPEGHFWMAANMGALAESFGLRQGLKYRGDIKEALELVLKIDPAFMDGSADRALGRWYYTVPGLFGGSKKKSEEHLRKSLTYASGSAASRFFLAETLFELGRDREARDELNKVVEGPVHPDWEPEDREFKALAAARLARR